MFLNFLKILLNVIRKKESELRTYLRKEKKICKIKMFRLSVNNENYFSEFFESIKI